MLSICVCGWYLEEFDDYYMSLHRIHKKYPVHVVSNCDSNYLKAIDLPYTIRENTGLEWGAYNHYLMNIWNGVGGVLFSHDDIEISATIRDGNTIVPPEYVFDRIASVDVDQAYIFGSRHEDVENYGMHGRMVYMGQNFLDKARKMGGFWFDDKNKGYTSGEDADLRKEYGCFGYNAGILNFHEQAKHIGGKIHCKMYIPSFSLAKRGERGNSTVQYGKWSAKVSSIIERAGTKLHIGCGDNVWPTHTNVDLYNEKADIKADARDLPISDNSYDMVETHHLIEHLAKSDAEKALKEWHRVLKPGGYIFLSCPDITAYFDLFKEAEGTPEVWDSLVESFYGEEAEGMAHRYGYCRSSLSRALGKAGFTNIEVRTAIGYRPTPSLIAIASKE